MTEQPENILEPSARRKAGHYEILGETYAKFEFFENGWNPYSRFLDVDKVDLILRRRDTDRPLYREVQVKYGKLYAVGSQWEQTLFDLTSWRFFREGEFNDYLNHPNFFQTPLDVATNIGNYTVPNAEICLLGIKGKPVHEYGIESVVFAPRLWHSKKPDEIRNRIAKYCRGAPKIELFARDKLPGWDSWGNQTKSDVELRFKT